MSDDQGNCQLFLSETARVRANVHLWTCADKCSYRVFQNHGPVVEFFARRLTLERTVTITHSFFLSEILSRHK